MTAFRLATGGRIDRAAPLAFTFDGRPLAGYQGDTLASALIANDVLLTGRSFKLHRPRGIFSAGPEEPSALVDIVTATDREANVPATTLPLFAGLRAESINAWPSLAFDLRASHRFLARFLGAGFYYKTFMAPGALWERLYEPFIRRAAGLGRLAGTPRPAGDIIHRHCDVLVIGAGYAGLSAALALGEAGLRVIIADQAGDLGGSSHLEPAAEDWRADVLRRLAANSDIRAMPGTTVAAAHDHGVFALVERTASGERMHIVRARRFVLASGTTERLIAFPDNDRPGVMLSGAGLLLLRHHAVAVGRRVAMFATNDEAYRAALALAEAGVSIAAIVDPRRTSKAADRARAAGLPVSMTAIVAGTRGTRRLTRIFARDLGGGAPRAIDCDALLVSGGWSPNIALARQAGATCHWDDEIHGFVPRIDPAIGTAAGGANGLVGPADCALDGQIAAETVLRSLGRKPQGRTTPAGLVVADDSPPAALSFVDVPGKAFVDLQNDVTVDDIRLAHREGYVHIEHTKRYTTHGMGTDQGKTGGLVGAAVLATLRGVPVAEVGMPTPRPFVTPVRFEALAGAETGAHFKAKRRLPLHDWHEARGATFALTGLWLRPLVYARESGWDPVLAEARHVREAVGFTDVSSLGKVEVAGPDAGRFLDRVYANRISTLAVGRCRYGLMLREDGLAFDDGTVARLATDHFALSTTTANHQAVLEHLIFHRRAVWPELDLVISDTADQWCQIAVAGPRARDVVKRLVTLDVSNEAFPFMAAAGTMIAGLAGRLFRISFSGELAYELAVPARHAAVLLEALLAVGKDLDLRPYGLDALNTLRIEKGHVTTAELNGQTTADDLGFGRMLKTDADFIGRTLARRTGLSDPSRPQLVGVRPVDRSRRLRNGAHLVAPDAASTSLGFVTSSTPAVAMDGWFGLALVSGGRARIGTRLLATSSIHGEETEVDLVSPHGFDPENARVRM